MKLIITESEKKRIKGLYSNEVFNNDIVITEWLSPDEKYVIFLDELYDIVNKTKIGNVWEHFDNFKMFLTHSFNVSDLPKSIKEDFSNTLNKIIITENINNISHLKNDFKKILSESESLWGNFKSWAAETGKSGWEGFKEFGKTVVKGGSELFDSVSKGEWKEVINLIKKGALYVFRKIRSAMYHPIGLILDAILVATGIGKGVQMVVWGIIVALDVYELISGNFEEDLPMGLRLLFLGVDIMGLVFAGGAAKAAKETIKGLVGGLKTTEEIGKVVSKNSWLRNILLKIYNGIKKVPSLLDTTYQTLLGKFPNGAKFIQGIMSGLGTILGKLTKFIGGVIKTPSKILNKVIPGQSKLAKGARAGVGTTALVGGLGTYHEYKKDKDNQDLLKNISFDDIEFT